MVSLLASLLDPGFRQAASVLVQVGQAEADIGDLAALVSEITVQAGRTEAATGTITFDDRRKEDGEWMAADSGLFTRWEPIKISADFQTHVGHTVVGAPLVFITVSASLAGYSGALELAAMTLGANHWQTFWSVTFPMTRIGIVTGGILAFAMSFDELMLALFLTGAGTRTLPRLIWEQLNYYLTPTIAAVASLVFLFTLILLAIVAVLQARSGGRWAAVHG
jgi:hypothetical protein